MKRSEDLIKRHEGIMLKPYKDTEGILTIGYGFNLEEGITQEIADQLFSHSMQTVYSDALSFPWYSELSDVRRAVIENMIFNLGRARFSGFKMTIAAIERGDYAAAASEMLDSKWRWQVGPRAVELSKMMRSGEWS